MEQKPVLTVQNLNCFYEDEHRRFASRTKRQQVLHDVSFCLYEGEILGLVGESGCGKTTLSKVITGLLHDYSGSVLCGTKFPQMVFQDPYSSLNPSFTVGRILEEPLRIQGKLNSVQRRQAVLQVLEQIGLGGEYASRLPSELSGGQRQRVALGAAVITHPRLIVADEPVSALDVTVQGQILELILELRKQYNLSVLFISHDLNVVYQICDRVMVMKNGHIVETNAAEAVFRNPQHPYTRQLLEAAR